SRSSTARGPCPALTSAACTDFGISGWCCRRSGPLSCGRRPGGKRSRPCLRWSGRPSAPASGMRGRVLEDRCGEVVDCMDGWVVDGQVSRCGAVGCGDLATAGGEGDRWECGAVLVSRDEHGEVQLVQAVQWVVAGGRGGVELVCESGGQRVVE